MQRRLLKRGAIIEPPGGAPERVAEDADSQLEASIHWRAVDDVRALCMNAEGHYVLGERRKALERIDSAYAIDPGDVCTLYNSACVFALDGEIDRALAAIEGAVRGGYTYREWLEHDPDLVHLRAHRRFQALMESLPLVTQGG